MGGIKRQVQPVKMNKASQQHEANCDQQNTLNLIQPFFFHELLVLGLSRLEKPIFEILYFLAGPVSCLNLCGLVHRYR